MKIYSSSLLLVSLRVFFKYTLLNSGLLLKCAEDTRFHGGCEWMNSKHIERIDILNLFVWCIWRYWISIGIEFIVVAVDGGYIVYQLKNSFQIDK